MQVNRGGIFPTKLYSEDRPLGGAEVQLVFLIPFYQETFC